MEDVVFQSACSLDANIVGVGVGVRWGEVFFFPFFGILRACVLILEGCKKFKVALFVT